MKKKYLKWLCYVKEAFAGMIIWSLYRTSPGLWLSLTTVENPENPFSFKKSSPKLNSYKNTKMQGLHYLRRKVFDHTKIQEYLPMASHKNILNNFFLSKKNICNRRRILKTNAFHQLLQPFSFFHPTLSKSNNLLSSIANSGIRFMSRLMKFMLL